MTTSVSLTFTKMHGAGNDFVLLIQPSPAVNERLDAEMIARICHRRLGVGADGLMVLESARTSDFALSYYNADGHPGEMCGNGARCAAWLAHEKGMAPTASVFDVWGVRYRAAVQPGQSVRLEMSPPRRMDFSADDAALRFEAFPDMALFDCGVPHLVVENSGDLQSLDVQHWGRRLRYHERFQPRGTNVNFIRRDAENKLSVRVYERGVEAETMACGTGAVSCAVYAAQRWDWRGPVSVDSAGGTLEIAFEPDFSAVSLTGPVVSVFEGSLVV